MAIWISMAAIGARISISSAAIGLPPSSSSPIGMKMARWATQVITAPMVAATEEIRMSRFCTCDSSWASTPSSSRRSRMGRMPWVTATAACWGLRPVAKALGCGLGETYRRGMGMPAWSARPLTIWYSSGNWASVTGTALAARMAILSEKK